jgi:hypothetical protein
LIFGDAQAANKAQKSMAASFSPPLITVWLQVRVLPGPPEKSGTYKIADFAGTRLVF